MPAVGGRAMQLTKKGGFGGTESVDGRFFYYAKSFAATGIWRIPVDGGEEQLVVPNLRYNLDFAVSSDGVYFIPNEESARGTIRFHDFRTSRNHDVFVADETLSYALSLSSDGRFLVYSGYKQARGDLMLVQNFR
jgi:hypothetical protein